MYGKLFAQMYDGTLATKGPWEALITFQQMIILCDQTGILDMTPEALSRRTTIPLEIIKAGIEALEQPDPESRTETLEGRRITRLSEGRSWGWQIVNYEHYRKIRSQEDRRTYQRELMRQRRAEVKAVSNPVSNVASVSEVSQSIKQKQKQKHIAANAALLPEPNGVTPEVWQEWVKHKGGKLTAIAYRNQCKFLAKQPDPNACIEQSLRNGWAGIFNVRDKTVTSGGFPATRADKRSKVATDMYANKENGNDITGEATRIE
jgi:hypothetical protein